MNSESLNILAILVSFLLRERAVEAPAQKHKMPAMLTIITPDFKIDLFHASKECVGSTNLGFVTF